MNPNKLHSKILIAAALGISLVKPTIIFALPSYPQPGIGVDVNINANTMNVNSQVPRAEISFTEHNIAPNEAVNYLFHESINNGVFLVNITGGNIANIHGHLTSNGSVILQNPAGIHFHNGSVIDVAGSLVAISANIINQEDFLNNGNLLQLEQNNNPGSIINAGNITAGNQGLGVLFIAPQVKNSGIIRAEVGTVCLASNAYQPKTNVDLSGDGLINFVINNEQTDLKYNHGEAITNNGDIIAKKVNINIGSASQIINNSINLDGFINANAITITNGNIKLTGSSLNNMTNTSTVSTQKITRQHQTATKNLNAAKQNKLKLQKTLQNLQQAINKITDEKQKAHEKNSELQNNSKALLQNLQNEIDRIDKLGVSAGNSKNELKADLLRLNKAIAAQKKALAREKKVATSEQITSLSNSLSIIEQHIIDAETNITTKQQQFNTLEQSLTNINQAVANLESTANSSSDSPIDSRVQLLPKTTDTTSANIAAPVAPPPPPPPGIVSSAGYKRNSTNNNNPKIQKKNTSMNAVLQEMLRHSSQRNNFAAINDTDNTTSTSISPAIANNSTNRPALILAKQLEELTSNYDTIVNKVNTAKDIAAQAQKFEQEISKSLKNNNNTPTTVVEAKISNSGTNLQAKLLAEIRSGANLRKINQQTNSKNTNNNQPTLDLTNMTAARTRLKSTRDANGNIIPREINRQNTNRAIPKTYNNENQLLSEWGQLLSKNDDFNSAMNFLLLSSNIELPQTNSITPITQQQPESINAVINNLRNTNTNDKSQPITTTSTDHLENLSDAELAHEINHNPAVQEQYFNIIRNTQELVEQGAIEPSSLNDIVLATIQHELKSNKPHNNLDIANYYINFTDPFVSKTNNIINNQYDFFSKINTSWKQNFYELNKNISTISWNAPIIAN